MFRPYVRGSNHFPKQDVVYWDFTELIAEPDVRSKAIQAVLDHFSDRDFTHVAAIEAKGFTIGSLLGHALHLPILLIRKPGLIPGRILSESFVKEYGTGTYEMAENRLPSKSRVLLVYDILAEAGATQAAIRLIERQGALVHGCAYIIELLYLNARQNLSGLNLFSLIQIDENEKNALQNH